MKKKRKSIFFRRQAIDMYFCRMQTASRQRHLKQSTKCRKTIVSRAMIQQIAQSFQSLKTHKISWKKRKSLRLLKKLWKKKKSFKSLSRDIDKISSMLRLENVANNEDFASREWIKNVSSKKATFSASFLKLRIVLFILQQFDSFAQRIRSFVEKASMKHDKENESVERHDSIKRDDVESNNTRKKVDFDFSFKWNIENDLLRWKNKWYIFSDLFKKELLKQNHDDSYADHFEHERTLNLLKKKYFWNNMSKDVKKYVDSCSIYHRVKLVRHKCHDLLQAFSISKNSR
jgi:hypothetical protein